MEEMVDVVSSVDGDGKVKGGEERVGFSFAQEFQGKCGGAWLIGVFCLVEG